MLAAAGVSIRFGRQAKPRGEVLSAGFVASLEITFTGRGQVPTGGAGRWSWNRSSVLHEVVDLDLAERETDRLGGTSLPPDEPDHWIDSTITSVNV